MFNNAIKDPGQIIKTKNMILKNSKIYKLIENEEKDNNKIVQLGQSIINSIFIDQVIHSDGRIQCCFCL